MIIISLFSLSVKHLVIYTQKTLSNINQNNQQFVILVIKHAENRQSETANNQIKILISVSEKVSITQNDIARRIFLTLISRIRSRIRRISKRKMIIIPGPKWKSGKVFSGGKGGWNTGVERFVGIFQMKNISDRSRRNCPVLNWRAKTNEKN